jgi:hypothetical protein
MVELVYLYFKLGKGVVKHIALLNDHLGEFILFTVYP